MAPLIHRVSPIICLQQPEVGWSSFFLHRFSFYRAPFSPHTSLHESYCPRWKNVWAGRPLGVDLRPAKYNFQNILLVKHIIGQPRPKGGGVYKSPLCGRSSTCIWGWETFLVVFFVQEPSQLAKKRSYSLLIFLAE